VVYPVYLICIFSALLFQLDISLMYLFCSLFNVLIKSTYLRYLLTGTLIILSLVFVINRTVSVATGYGLDGRGIGARIPVEEDFSPLHVSRLALGPPQPQIHCVPGVKWPWRKAHHSLPNSAKVDMWIYTSAGTILPSPNLPQFTSIQAND
jgi:hypothetical protein